MEKWKEDLYNSLGKALEEQQRKQEDDKQKRLELESKIKEFAISKVEPAFEELRIELVEKYRLDIRTDMADIHAHNITVVHNQHTNKEKKFKYTIRAEIEKTPEGEISPNGISIFPMIEFNGGSTNHIIS